MKAVSIDYSGKILSEINRNRLMLKVANARLSEVMKKFHAGIYTRDDVNDALAGVAVQRGHLRRAVTGKSEIEKYKTNDFPEFRVSGIPCFLRPVGSFGNQYFYDVLDRRGYVADWLQRKMTNSEKWEAQQICKRIMGES